MKFHITASIAIASIMLTACGGEPSSADIKAAYEREITKADKAAEAMVGSNKVAKDMVQSMQTKIHDAKKIACKKAEGNPGYRCDFELDIEAPFVGRTKQAGSARFVKGDSGWQVLQ
jgi:hypothetical protein